MANRFVDLTGGNNGNDGSTFANRVLTIDSSGMTAARQAAGDTIRIMKSPDPTTLSTTALWTNASRNITLTTAVTKTFDNGSSWTKSANVSGTTTAAKIGSGTTLIFAAGFTTGLAAYKDLGSTLDFSAYQQISFWFKNDTNTTASTFRIDLCSDAVGAVPVNSFTMTKAIVSGNSTRWQPIVLDNGSALSSTVRSIAVTCLLDPGTATIILNNIIACQAPTSADCLTLYSLISKSNAPSGVTGWYRPASIDGTAIVIDQIIQTNANGARTYEGVTETVTTYVRQCIPLYVAGLPQFAAQLSGSDGSVISYSGGWDTTAMSSRTGETWIIDYSSHTSNTGFDINGKSFLSLDRIAIVGSPGAVFGDSATTAVNVAFSNCWSISSAGFFSNMSSPNGGWSWTSCFQFYCSQPGWSTNAALTLRQQFLSCAAVGNLTSNGWNCGHNTYLKNCAARNNGATGYVFFGCNPDEYQLDSCTGGLNVTSDVSFSSTSVMHVKGINCTFASSTPFTKPANGGDESSFYSINDGNVANATVITGTGHVITQQTATRHTASGTAWKISPTSTNYTLTNPCRLQVAKFYVSASSLVTVSIWVQRDNTGLTLNLVAPIQAGIIATEQSASAAAAINTWEQLTITFTPAVAGVVLIWVHASGGSTNSGYADDLTITQA